MHPPAQPLLDRSQRRPHPLGHRDPLELEPATTPGLPAAVREAQEVERLRATVAATRSAFGREATELDEPRLGVMQLQAELGEA
jgi:hypothetical protein